MAKARTWPGWLLYLRREGGAWDADGQACVYLSRSEAESHRESPYEELVRVRIVEQPLQAKTVKTKKKKSRVPTSAAAVVNPVFGAKSRRA